MKNTDYLILVNEDTPFDKAFLDTIELVSFKNVWGKDGLIEKETYEAYLGLVEELKAVGVTAGAGGVFRTVEYQQELMDHFIRDKGEEYAKRFVATPGRSEHHTGLAIDLLPFVGGAYRSEHKDLFAAADIFAKIHPLLPKHGFILRYPADKESVTKISYEPWHIRYVGLKAAAEMAEKGLTLEEYTASIKAGV